MRFRTTISINGKTATGIRVPDDVMVELGAGKRPPVRVTINGHTYRTTVATLGGVSMCSVSSDVRRAAGVAGGDEVAVDLELDTEPRTVTVPDDLGAALAAEPAARAFFDGLSYSHQSAYVQWIESAKKPETRQRRVPEAVGLLRAGRKQR